MRGVEVDCMSAPDAGSSGVGGPPLVTVNCQRVRHTLTPIATECAICSWPTQRILFLETRCCETINQAYCLEAWSLCQSLPHMGAPSIREPLDRNDRRRHTI